MKEREVVCEKVELTTWDDIAEMHDVLWEATFRTGDTSMVIKVSGDGIPEFQPGHIYAWRMEQVA